MQTDPHLTPKAAGAKAALVVGTMNFGKRTDAAESERVIARALERGLRWFDTANVYNDGESERIVGRALKGKADARIATKVGFGKLVGPKEGLSPQRIAAALDESLQRLGRDHIDLYYLHVPDPATPIEDTLEAIEAARTAGKIGEWGVSNYASWQIADIFHRCAKFRMNPPRVSQVLYNLLVRQLDLEYFAFAKQFQLHTTVFNPLAGGLLAGKGLDGKVEAGSRFDGNKLYQRRYLSDRFYELTRAYAQLARDASIDPVALAYAFCAQRPGVDSVLLGPASVLQLDAGIEGCALPLAPALLAKIDELHRSYVGTDVSYAR